MANPSFTSFIEDVNEMGGKPGPRNSLFIIRSFSKFVLQELTGSVHFIEEC